MSLFGWLDNTARLMRLLDKKNRYLNEDADPWPDQEHAVSLLREGAKPWGKDQAGICVFDKIVAAWAPAAIVDAWFEAVGDMSLAPWTTHGLPHPLTKILGPYTTRGPEFVIDTLDRILRANAPLGDLEADENPVVKRLVDGLESHRHIEQAFELLKKNHMDLFFTPAARAYFADVEQRLGPDNTYLSWGAGITRQRNKKLLRFLVDCQAQNLDMNSPKAQSATPVRRL